MRNLRPTVCHPTCTVTVLSNGLYSCIASNGIGSSRAVGGRPTSAIVSALRDLRGDYRETASVIRVTVANFGEDDRGSFVGREIALMGDY